jgi:hypothetical protein
VLNQQARSANSPWIHWELCVVSKRFLKRIRAHGGVVKESSCPL